MFYCSLALRSLHVLSVLFLIHFISGCKQRHFFEDAGPLVKTTTGAVVGKYVKVFNTDVAAFLGIPYAEPPVGEKRFLKPDPVKPWGGLYQAQEMPPPCMQFSRQNYTWVSAAQPSEDCLYLNVWIPTKCSYATAERLPVMVWIHGGAFTSGSTDVPIYDGRTLAAFGEVIVVTLNYRVGLFGFLGSGTEEAPGNAGLFDQVLAMKWVKDNIEAFGGDSERITIFGESAGSWSVSMHLISPMSRNLFHRAILQSGSMYHPNFALPLEKSRFLTNLLAKTVGCASDEVNLDTDHFSVLQCLKQKDPMTLSVTEDALRSTSPIFFMPSVGNEFLPRHPIEFYESGNIAPVDVLIGGVQDEATIFISVLLSDYFSLYEEPKFSMAEVNRTIPSLFKLVGDVPDEVLRKIHSYYFQGIDVNDKSAIVDAFNNAFGDFIFNCPSMFLAEKLNKAYMYWITHLSVKNTNADWVGVHHFYDVPYVFGVPIMDATNFTPEDERFSYDIIQKWTNFARNGYPLKDERQQDWPTFTSWQPTTLELNPRSTQIIDFPRREACEFWRSMAAQNAQVQANPPVRNVPNRSIKTATSHYRKTSTHYSRKYR